jgi:hypothetical protein
LEKRGFLLMNQRQGWGKKIGGKAGGMEICFGEGGNVSSSLKESHKLMDAKVNKRTLFASSFDFFLIRKGRRLSFAFITNATIPRMTMGSCELIRR